MIDNEKELSKYRLEKSKEDMKSAKVLLDCDMLKQSINRSYYAIFHATRALLALDKFDSKKHSGIISFFNRNYAATGRIEKEYSKILMEAQNIRNLSDYNDFYIASREEADTQLKNAQKFIEMIEEYLKKTSG